MHRDKHRKDVAPVMSEQPTYGTLDETEKPSATEYPETGENAPKPLSILEQMRADIEEELEDELDEVKNWDVPARPRYKLKFNTYLDGERFVELREAATTATQNRKARRSGEPGKFDGRKFALSLIRELTAGIIFDGNAVHLESGQPLTLTDREFLDIVKGTKYGENVHTINHAIEKFLTPGYLIAMGDSLVEACGYTVEANPNS